MNIWLLKTEPSTYSFSQLQKDKITNWNNIRNYQARNFMRQMKKGDLVVIYHSGDEKAVVGIARVVKEAYPDLDKDNSGDWVQVDIEPVEELKNSISLSQLKSDKRFSELLLIKQSRLSVMPVTKEHFELFKKLTP